MAHLERTRVRAQLARVHLLYGERLPTACDMLDADGCVQAFGERARRERLATGEIARNRTVETTGELTSQEVHIARPARDGLSNPEIGARLFISASSAASCPGGACDAGGDDVSGVPVQPPRRPRPGTPVRRYARRWPGRSPGRCAARAGWWRPCRPWR
jgi:hypothetical protein